MREVRHSALVAQSPQRLYDLINDIDNYPAFIPWCTRATVLSRSEQEIVATIGVQRGPLQSEFTTRNVLEPHRRILMHLVDGPFRMLEGEWLLTAIAPANTATAANNHGAEGCRVQLTMKFAFRNPLTAMLFEQKFAETTSVVMDAFVARARILPP